MRLDHLLSREKAEGETRKLIPRSMRASESGSEETRSKLVKGAARAAKHGNASAKTGESVAQDAQRHGKLLKIGKIQSVSFSGLGSSNGIETDRREGKSKEEPRPAACTLTTAQQERFKEKASCKTE